MDSNFLLLLDNCNHRLVCYLLVSVRGNAESTSSTTTLASFLSYMEKFLRRGEFLIHVITASVGILGFFTMISFQRTGVTDILLHLRQTLPTLKNSSFVFKWEKIFNSISSGRLAMLILDLRRFFETMPLFSCNLLSLCDLLGITTAMGFLDFRVTAILYENFNTQCSSPDILT